MRLLTGSFLRRLTLPAALLAAVAVLGALAAVSAGHAMQPPPSGRPLVFDGARLITPNLTAPLDDAVVVVAGGRFVSAGRRADVKPPADAIRMDARGKTIVPALVNAHVHLGYDRELTFEAANFTRENVSAQLERYAQAGVAAVLSLGTDLPEVTAEIRTRQASGALAGARLRTAGRGIAPPNAGPANAQMRPAALGVTTEEEARAAVREQAGRVEIVKIWVDDRNGSVPKLSPALARAVTEEAHRLGLQVIAHIFYLEDLRALVDLGVNGFAHLPRDAEIDAALAARMKERNVFVLPNLSVSENGVHAQPPDWIDDPLLRMLVTPEPVARLRESFTRRTPAAVERAQATYRTMQRSLQNLVRAGVRIGFATDAGAVRDLFHGFTDHRELKLMVEAGLTPLQALTAATIESARITGLDRELGTIEPGKSADFIVLDANPLDDIAHTRRIAAVYLRGVEVNREGGLP
jgi:imidazolonepropionase-like amidohydrolase